MYKNLGFIGGGQMAEAIITGLIQSKTFTPAQIRVAELVESRRDYLAQTYQVETFTDLSTVVSLSEVIILAVKPQAMEAVLTELKSSIGNHLLISIAAGIPLSFYQSILNIGSLPIIRVMPNLPALIQMGATAMCKNGRVSQEQLDFGVSLFNTLGTTVIVREKDMDAVTGLSGSGPAYVCSFVEALIDAGVKTGLSREAAKKLSIQTVLGTAAMLEQTDKHPATLRDRVTSPGGTAISGLHVLEESGFNGIVMNAVETAANRSISLGKG